MTPEEYGETLARLREIALSTEASSTADELLSRAVQITGQLSDGEREAAATLYVVRLLRDAHRTTVAGIERDASARKTRDFQLDPEVRKQYEERAAERERASQERRARMIANMNAAMKDYENNLKMEWTRDLLDSTFALPDGALVAWGSATIEQHLIRRDMLLKNAAGNVEAASRHEAAITLLRSSGASSLDDTQRVPA